MEKVFNNPGLIDIREQIFGYFDAETLENCREVFAEKFGEDWDWWLERLYVVQLILEFGDLPSPEDPLMEFSYVQYVRDFIPGWDKAVKKFDKTASLNDLNEVEESLKGFYDYMIDYARRHRRLHYAAEKGHVKLMELLFFTDVDINEGDAYDTTPFIEACRFGQTEIMNLMITASNKYCIDLNAFDSLFDFQWKMTGFMYACQGGQTEIVNLMINASRNYDIDLNAREDETKMTGFLVACLEGHTEIVNLMITASKDHGIDLNASDGNGQTGLMFACKGGFTEIVKLMIENRTKCGINIHQEDHDGDNALEIINIKIKEVSEDEETPLCVKCVKEVKHILEKAYLEDNEPQPKYPKLRLRD